MNQIPLKTMVFLATIAICLLPGCESKEPKATGAAEKATEQPQAEFKAPETTGALVLTEFTQRGARPVPSRPETPPNLKDALTSITVIENALADNALDGVTTVAAAIAESASAFIAKQPQEKQALLQPILAEIRKSIEMITRGASSGTPADISTGLEALRDTHLPMLIKAAEGETTHTE